MNEGQTAPVVNLNALPRSIYDTHRRLRQAIDKLCMLEDFLLGEKPRAGESEEKKLLANSFVDKCFANLHQINNSIAECHDQLVGIINKLGVPDIKEVNMPEREVLDA